MSLTKIAFAMLCLITMSIEQSRGEDKDAVREKLDTAIGEGIRLLEAKEYVAFLKNFVEPEAFKKFSEAGNIEDFAQKFGESKAKQLTEVLKSIKTATPKISEDGKKATFDISVEGVSKKNIAFTKIGKYWYINN